jgi:EAL domain-containing protein (putative c-di-GMP-specific phosphodiesterase class I)
MSVTPLPPPASPSRSATPADAAPADGDPRRVPTLDLDATAAFWRSVGVDPARASAHAGGPSLLDRLLAPGAMSTLFQPIFDLRARAPRLAAVECLTRGPAGSSLESPAALFEYARRKREEAVVDRAAVASALRSAAALPASLPLHLNVHASTLSRDEGFPVYLEQIARSAGIAIGRLVVEVVEHADLYDERVFLASLQSLRGRGVRIGLDDVGHGRANFRLMLLCRPELLKVDSYLVRGIAEDKARQAVLAMLHEAAGALGGALVVEGIEELEDLEKLRELGIPLGQGFLLARPLSAHELLAHRALAEYEARPFDEAVSARTG